ncbi:GGDEF domain-containing protein [Psychrobium sp. nBUS_13]|uniref:GGDEF domain-containing protein n=1 Tax=Psychrobium sp. nBUS_13 TaxID=3395319 RepID=UPI003EBD8EC2
MNQIDFKEFHWMVSMINSIDAGLIVLDNDYVIESWNGFMYHHSNIHAADAKGKNIFDIFQDLDKSWFMRKVEAVKTIQNQSFITWEQKPYIFPFKNYRPITGTVEHMHQNVTILPLPSLTGSIDQICLIIYDVTDIAANRMELQKANSQLEKLTKTDPLTQIDNRNGLAVNVDLANKRYKMQQTVSSLVMLDIDHFKQINDTHGHPAGDAILQQLAAIIKESMRENDSVARYGGEEFAIILHNTTSNKASHFVERLRKAIEDTEFALQETVIKVTISFGIAQISTKGGDNKAWMEAADKALYQAKRQGRNQGVVYESMD